MTKLFVNDRLQDIYLGITGYSCLTGKLPNGKEIKARFCGIKTHCYIFINHELVLEV